MRQEEGGGGGGGGGGGQHALRPTPRFPSIFLPLSYTSLLLFSFLLFFLAPLLSHLLLLLFEGIACTVCIEGIACTVCIEGIACTVCIEGIACTLFMM